LAKAIAFMDLHYFYVTVLPCAVTHLPLTLVFRDRFTPIRDRSTAISWQIYRKDSLGVCIYSLNYWNE